MLEQFANLGKTSYLLTVLKESPDRYLRRKFLKDFGWHPDPQIRSWVGSLTKREHDSMPRYKAKSPATRAAAVEGL